MHDAVDHLRGQARAAGRSPSRSSRAISSAGRALHQVADRAGAEHLEHRGRSSKAESAITRVSGETRMISAPLAGRRPPACFTSTSATSGRRGHGELDRLDRRRLPSPTSTRRVLVGEQVCEGATQGGLVVGDQDADRRHGRHRAAGGSSDGNHGADRTRRREGVQPPGRSQVRDPRHRPGASPPGVLSMRRSETCSEVSDDAREIRHPAGTQLSCRSWPQEAALRMLMNNLDPEVAERPEDLVVYGGTGPRRAVWEALRRDRAHAAATLARRRDAARAVRQAGRRLPHARRWRRAC